MAQLNTRIVIRNDSTVNWNTHEDVVLLKGEIGIEFLDSGEAKIKIGDGTKTWAQLDYFGGENTPTQIFQGTDTDSEGDAAVISTITSGATLAAGDIAIISQPLTEDLSEKTAYVYNGTEWIALKGNYDAENVYFNEDLTITANIGVQTVGSSGSKSLDTTGKNLKQVLDLIMAQEKNPTIQQPFASLSVPQIGSYEVGTSVTPSYTLTLNPGSYQYGPATGVTATAYTVDDNSTSEAQNTSTGSFPAFTVTDETTYFLSGNITHTAGAIPLTNLGNEYAAGAIQAGTKITSSSNITGYRNSFYGTVTNKNTVTSDIIRGLTKTNKALANGNTFSVSIPVGALRVIIAYPATLRDVTSIKDVNGLNAEIKSGFTQSTIAVEGNNGYTAINYKVYTLDFANPNDTANTYSVQI